MELELDLDSERRLYEAGIRPSAEIGLLLLSRLEQAEQALDAAERQVVARSGETAAERIWRGRAEQAEQAVARVREVVGEDAPSFFTNEAMHAYDKAMSEITRALDGDGRG